MGQMPPCATGSEHVEESIHHLSVGPEIGAPFGWMDGKEGLQDLPLLVRHVAGIGFSFAHPKYVSQSQPRLLAVISTGGFPLDPPA